MARFSAGAIKQRLSRLKGWKQAGNTIQKQYTFTDFREAMFFVNSIAAVAEKVGHHPDIAISYNRVTLSLSTHDAGGVTAKDFSLATRVEAIR